MTASNEMLPGSGRFNEAEDLVERAAVRGLQTDETMLLGLAIRQIVELVHELDRLHADGMPRDREELQKLLNDAHRKGNQEAHEAHRLVREMGLSAQGGEVPEPTDDDLEAIVFDVGGDPSNGFERALVHNGWAWLARRFRPAPPHPDTVEVCEWHPGDIPGTGVRGWKTSCGEAMYPKHRWRIGEDGLNFCPNCGKRAVQVTDDEWAARSAQAQPTTNETRG